MSSRIETCGRAAGRNSLNLQLYDQTQLFGPSITCLTSSIIIYEQNISTSNYFQYKHVYFYYLY